MSVPEFDQFSSDYRQVHDANLRISGARSEFFARQKAGIICRFERSSGQSLLDIGCGDGSCLRHLSMLMPSFRLTGIDPSRDTINAAKMTPPAVTFDVGDATALPYMDEQFDVVLLANVLHHIEPLRRGEVVKEINRVLKKKGRLYVFEHNPWNPFAQYLVKTCPFDKGVKLLSRSRVQQLIRSGGFSVSDSPFINFLPPRPDGDRLPRLQQFLSPLPLGAQYFVRAVKD